MQRDRPTPLNHVAPSALAEEKGADASFIDSLMDLLDVQGRAADDEGIGQAEAKLSRRLRDTIGAKLRDAA